MASTRTPLAVALCLAPLAAPAHPHVFVDATARFVFEGPQVLSRVEIVHRYDPLYSLFLLQDLGIDPFAPLSAPDTARLVAEYETFLASAHGFAALSAGGSDVPFAAPADVGVSVRDDRVEVTFAVPLAAPLALDGSAVTLDIFDPLYFVDFGIVGPVMVTGATDCTARALDWVPSPRLLALQSALSTLPPDQDPEDRSVGRLFAAQAQVRCR